VINNAINNVKINTHTCAIIECTDVHKTDKEKKREREQERQRKRERERRKCTLAYSFELTHVQN